MKKLRTGIKEFLILLIIMLVFPAVSCFVYHMIDPSFTIGAGDYFLENHYMGKYVLIEVGGLYKNIDVEEYVVGVMAGVIPADYNMQVLMTQAVLIRTNVLKEMEEKNTKDAADLSYEYLTKEERKKLWGRKRYDRNESMMERAVVNTAGKVLRKENNLIMAMYHQVSIGKTADASEILGEDISYLKSVDSSKDVEAKDYMNIFVLSPEDLYNIIIKGEDDGDMHTEGTHSESEQTKGTPEEAQAGGVQNQAEQTEDAQVGESREQVGQSEGAQAGEAQNQAGQSEGAQVGEAQNQAGQSEGAETEGIKISGKQTDDSMDDEDKALIKQMDIHVDESTENGFVKTVTACGNTYTGEEFAALLGLPSTNFYVEEVSDGIRIVCLGKGSCLGVSQYGANVMADNGSSMEDIINYYYDGVSLEQAFPD